MSGAMAAAGGPDDGRPMPAWVVDTQRALTPYMANVPTKFLLMPPLPFIRDVVKAVDLRTGLFMGVFPPAHGEELTRDQRIEFLTLLINHVTKLRGGAAAPLDIRVATVMAGLQPEKTAILLQEIARLATLAQPPQPPQSPQSQQRRSPQRKPRSPPQQPLQVLQLLQQQQQQRDSDAAAPPQPDEDELSIKPRKRTRDRHSPAKPQSTKARSANAARSLRKYITGLDTVVVHPEQASDADLNALAKHAGGVQSVVDHMTRFRNLCRTFASVAELMVAITEATEAGSYVDEVARRELVKYLSNPKLCRLFSEAGPLQVTGIDLDAVIEEGGGWRQTLMYLRKFDSEGKKFRSLHDLPPAIAAVRSSASSPSSLLDVSRIIDYLNSPDCPLFNGTVLPASNPMQVVALAEHGGGVEITLEHLRRFSQVYATFATMDDLFEAITLANATGSHVSEDVRRELVAHLSDPAKCRLFRMRGPMHVRGDQIDMVVHAGRGLQATLTHLRKYDRLRRTFDSLEDLAVSLEHTASTGVYLASLDRKLIATYLASPECALFNDTGNDVRVTALDLDAAALASGGAELCVENLRQLDAQKQRFQTIAELVAVLSSRRPGGREHAWGLPALPPINNRGNNQRLVVWTNPSKEEVASRPLSVPNAQKQLILAPASQQQADARPLTAGALPRGRLSPRAMPKAGDPAILSQKTPHKGQNNKLMLVDPTVLPGAITPPDVEAFDEESAPSPLDILDLDF